jgi:hypothetical protein
LNIILLFIIVFIILYIIIIIYFLLLSLFFYFMKNLIKKVVLYGSLFLRSTGTNYCVTVQYYLHSPIEYPAVLGHLIPRAAGQGKTLFAFQLRLETLPPFIEGREILEMATKRKCYFSRNP